MWKVDFLIPRVWSKFPDRTEFFKKKSSRSVLLKAVHCKYFSVNFEKFSSNYNL